MINNLYYSLAFSFLTLFTLTLFLSACLGSLITCLAMENNL